MMPLVLGDAGCEYDIKKIGGNDEVRTRLSAMGFVPGAKVTLVSCNNGSAPLSRMSASASSALLLARRIMV